MSGRGSELVDELMRLRPEGLTANAWAIKAGVSRTIWADLKRHGNPSRRTLERLLVAAGSSLAEFEALRIGPERFMPGDGPDRFEDRTGAFHGFPLPQIPLVASYPSENPTLAVPGWEAMRIVPSEVTGRLERPVSLAQDRAAYAVQMVGASMWPRFRQGRRIAVSPAAAIHDGDDVLIVLRRATSGLGNLVLIAELVSKGRRAFHIRQFNPERTAELPVEEIVAVEKVLGELI